jgi:hypothetical protein
MNRFAVLVTLVLGCVVSAAAEVTTQTSDAVSTNSLYLEHGSLPPFLKGACEGRMAWTKFRYDKLQDGERYGLNYVYAEEEKSAPREMWVHKVVRWIPPRDPQWGVDFARKEGLTNAPHYSITDVRGVTPCDKERDWTFFDIFRNDEWGISAGVIRYCRGPFMLNLMYNTAALRVADYDSKDNKLMTPAQAYEAGRAALGNRGLWPSNVGTNYYPGYVLRDVADGRRDLGGDLRFVIPWGFIEGWQAHGGDSISYTFTISVTGGLDHIEIGWRETERYGLVELKTPKEAFEDLDRGYSMPLERRMKGLKIRFSHCAYMMSLPEMEYVYPVYIFDIFAKKVGDGIDIYVPAIASRYFVNPKEQVKVRLPPAERPRNVGKRTVMAGPLSKQPKLPVDLRTIFMAFEYVTAGIAKPTGRTNEWVLTARNDIACKLLVDPVLRVEGSVTNNATLLGALDREDVTAILFLSTTVDCDDRSPEGSGWLMVGDHLIPVDLKNYSMRLDINAARRAETIFRYDMSKPLSDLAEEMRKKSSEWMYELQYGGSEPLGAPPSAGPHTGPE